MGHTVEYSKELGWHYAEGDQVIDWGFPSEAVAQQEADKEATIAGHHYPDYYLGGN